MARHWFKQPTLLRHWFEHNGGGYDSADFVAELRQACVTPHVARKVRHSAIDARHAGYALSQKRRKKIEESFGWAKTIGGRAQTAQPRRCCAASNASAPDSP